jgi:hypothetical protein
MGDGFLCPEVLYYGEIFTCDGAATLKRNTQSFKFLPCPTCADSEDKATAAGGRSEIASSRSQIMCELTKWPILYRIVAIPQGDRDPNLIRRVRTAGVARGSGARVETLLKFVGVTQSQLEPVPAAGPVKDLSHVVLNHEFADAHGTRDFDVFVTGGDKTRDFE